MKTHTLETSVGVFVLIGLICVGYLTVKLGKMEWVRTDHYYLDARFTSVEGLKKGAAVDVAGVQIGKVESIRLDYENMVARVRLKIKAGVPISEDVIAAVKTSGLIGDKYISLSPGGSETLLKSGDRIVETQSSVDMEAMIAKYAFGGI